MMLLQWFLVAILFLLGSAIGSFLLVVADRYMAQEKFLTGRSRCDSCGHQLSWFDLVPYISFIVSGGACRYCHVKLSFSYPIFELLSGVLCVGLFIPAIIGYGSMVDAILLYIIACVLLILVRIDMVHMVLPDIYIGMVLVLVVARLFVQHTAAADTIAYGALIGAGFLYGLWVLTGGAGLGFGDVKLMIPLGMMFGMQGTVTLLFIAFFIGGLIGIILLALKKVHAKTAVPFGPFIIVAAYLLMLFPGISDRFFQLIGVQ